MKNVNFDGIRHPSPATRRDSPSAVDARDTRQPASREREEEREDRETETQVRARRVFWARNTSRKTKIHEWQKRTVSCASCCLTGVAIFFILLALAPVIALLYSVIHMKREGDKMLQSVTYGLDDTIASILPDDYSYTIPSPIDYHALDVAAVSCSGNSNGDELYRFACGKYNKSHSFFSGVDAHNAFRVEIMKKGLSMPGGTGREYFRHMCHSDSCESMYRFYKECERTDRKDMRSERDRVVAEIKKRAPYKADGITQLAFLASHGLLSPLTVRLDRHADKLAVHVMVARDTLLRGTVLESRARGRTSSKLYVKRGEVRHELNRFISHVFTREDRAHLRDRIIQDHIFVEEVILEDGSVMRPDAILSRVNSMSVQQRERLLSEMIEKTFDFALPTGYSCWVVTSRLFPTTMCDYYKHVDQQGPDEDAQRRALFDYMASRIKGALLKRYPAALEKLGQTRYMFDDCSSFFHSQAAYTYSKWMETVEIGSYLEKDSIPAIIQRVYSHHNFSLLHNAMELVSDKKVFYDDDDNDNDDDNENNGSGGSEGGGEDWFNSPVRWIAQVDAWYDPYHRKVVFPPGLCSAPMFTPLYSDHARYGMMGFIIAHELTHVVDEFIPQSEKAITTRAFLEFDSMASQRISENIADRVAISVIAGIVEDDHRANTVEVCKTLLAFSQLWCANREYTPSTDVHSSFKNRLRGPLTLLFRDRPTLRKDCFCIKR